MKFRADEHFKVWDVAWIQTQNRDATTWMRKYHQTNKHFHNRQRGKLGKLVELSLNFRSFVTQRREIKKKKEEATRWIASESCFWCNFVMRWSSFDFFTFLWVFLSTSVTGLNDISSSSWCFSIAIVDSTHRVNSSIIVSISRSLLVIVIYQLWWLHNQMTFNFYLTIINILHASTHEKKNLKLAYSPKYVKYNWCLLFWRKNKRNFTFFLAFAAVPIILSHIFRARTTLILVNAEWKLKKWVNLCF